MVGSIRDLLLKTFKVVVDLPKQTLDSLFFPNETIEINKDCDSIFKNMEPDSALFALVAERAFKLISEEENRMAALVHLLRVHVNNCLPGVTDFEDEMAKELLNLFEFFLEKCSLQGINGELNSIFGLENWRDTYGMTFLMRLFSNNVDSLYVSTNGVWGWDKWTWG